MLNKKYEKSVEIIYNEIKKYDWNTQLDILRDCGLSSMIDSHRLLSGEESFRIMLKMLISKIKSRGNEIKGASWSGIYETIIREAHKKT